MDKEVWNMTPLEKAAHWDRCYPGNLNIEMMVNELAAEITRLTAELAEARALLQEAGKALDSLMFQFVRDNTGNFSEEAATYTKLKEAGYVE